MGVGAKQGRPQSPKREQVNLEDSDRRKTPEEITKSPSLEAVAPPLDPAGSDATTTPSAKRHNGNWMAALDSFATPTPKASMERPAPAEEEVAEAGTEPFDSDREEDPVVQRHQPASPPKRDIPHSLPVTAQRLEEHNRGQTLGARPSTGLSLLEEYELHQRAKHEKESAAAAPDAEDQVHSPRSRKSFHVPSLLTSRQLILCEEPPCPMPTFGNISLKKSISLPQGLDVRGCWRRIGSMLDFKTTLNMVCLSREARHVWLPVVESHVVNLLTMEVATRNMNEAQHRKVIEYVLENQTTISRDIFRVLNVICELARGSRCMNFEDCTTCLQGAYFLAKLRAIRPANMSLVSRDANAAVLRRIDPTTLPDVIAPLYTYCMMAVGLNTDIKNAIALCERNPMLKESIQ